jgi:transcriptional regulator with XRE-family HTH domain
MSKLMQWLDENTRPNYTLDGIAEKLKVSQSIVTLWRQGKRKPGRAQLRKLSQLTGLRVEDLL